MNPYLSYAPHNSFDSNGYLQREALNASDQLTQHLQSRFVMPQQQQTQQQQQQPQVVVQHMAPFAYEKEAQELTSEILGEVVDRECSVLGREIVLEVLEDEAAVLVMQVTSSTIFISHCHYFTSMCKFAFKVCELL